MEDNSTNLELEKSKYHLTKLIIWVSITVLIFLILSSIIISNYDFKLNEVGDSFGILNTLFSGLTFVGVIYTIILQRVELQRQQKQIDDVKTDSKKQLNTIIKTAKLNALCSIFQHHTEIKLHSLDGAEKRSASSKLQETAMRIDALLLDFDSELDN